MASPEEDVSNIKNKSTKLPRAVYTLFYSLILDLLGFTLILPLLPSLLEYYGSQKDPLYQYLNSYVQGFRVYVGAPDTPRWNGVLFGGLIGSWFSLLQFVAAPAIGAASDVHGRRPMLILCLFGIAFSYCLWAVSSSFTLFVLARTIGGLFKGNISLCTAVVSDTCDRSNRGKGNALVGIAFSLGFLLGPLIGALFASWARQYGGPIYGPPALFALSLALLNLLFISCTFKETLPLNKRARSVVSSLSDSMHLVNPWSLFRFNAVKGQSLKDVPEMRKLGFVYFTFLLIYSGLEFTLTFLTHNKFQYNSMQQGQMFLFMGLVMAAIQGGYVRRITPGTEKRVAVMGMLMLVLSFTIISLAPSVTVFYVGISFFAFASATVVPCLTTALGSLGAADQRGTITGVFRSLGALARALGPGLASTAYWCVGAETSYLMGAGLSIIPLWLGVRLQSKTKSQ